MDRFCQENLHRKHVVCFHICPMNSAGFWCSLSWKNTSLVCWQQFHSPIKSEKKPQNRSSEATSFHSKISIFRVKLWKMWRPAKYWFQTIGISPNRLWFCPIYIYYITIVHLCIHFQFGNSFGNTKMVWKKSHVNQLGLNLAVEQRGNNATELRSSRRCHPWRDTSRSSSRPSTSCLVVSGSKEGACWIT